MFDASDAEALERRLLRTMCVVAAMAALVSLFFAPWRVTAGLVLGGVLAVFNYRWLHSSTAAMLGTGTMGRRERMNASRYVLRYFIVAAIVCAAYAFNLVSLVATLVGLCSFAAAALLEAFVQIYFAIIHREDS